MALLTQIPRQLAAGISSILAGLGRISFTSGRFIRNTFRAHYNLLGRYTSPIEEDVSEFLAPYLGTEKSTPPELNQFNSWGQIAGQVAISPLLALSWILSLTVGPLLYHSLRFFKLSFLLAVANLPLMDLPERRGSALQVWEEYKELPWYRILFAFTYGLPGLIVSATLGLVVATFVVLARTVTNSFKSFYYGFIFTTDLALDSDMSLKEIPMLYNDKRNGIQAYLFGGLGGALGLVLGLSGFAVVALARFIINSYINLRDLAFAGRDLVLSGLEKAGNDFEFDWSDKPHHKYFFGAPGLILGLLVAAPLGIVYGFLERVIIESVKTTKNLFIRMVDAAFTLGDEVEEFSLSQSDFISISYSDDPDFYLFGLPGSALGAFVGSISYLAILAARTVYHSALTGLSSILAITNEALHQDNQLPRFKEWRNNAQVFRFGLVGLGIGYFLGAIGFALVGLGRIVTNSIKTALNETATGANLILYADMQLPFAKQHDVRSEIYYGLGFIGIPVGIIGAFFVGVPLALAFRITVESWRSTKLAYETIVNEAKLITDAAGDADEGSGTEYLFDSTIRSEVVTVKIQPQSQLEDEVVELVQPKGRLMVDLVLGALGYLVGGFGGIVVSAGVFADHTLDQSYQSLKHTFASMTNLSLQSKYQIENYDLLADPRLPKRKYGFGAPGVLVGFLTGILGSLIAGIVLNSYETTKNLTYTALNAVRKKEKYSSENLSTDPRGFFLTYIFGLPGLLVGLVTSFLAVTIVALNRSRIESWLTLKEYFWTIVHQALPERKGESESNESAETAESSFFDETRSNTDRFFGSPGILIGIIAGVVSFAAIGLARVVINSLETTLRAYISFVNLALANHEFETSLKNDPRKASVQYLGYLGYIPGAIFGFIFGFLPVGLYRSVGESWNNFKKLSLAGMNFARHNYEEESGAFEWDWQENKLSKYLLGAPGILFGVLGAAAGAILSGLARTTLESWKAGKRVFFSMADAAREGREEYVVADIDATLDESGMSFIEEDLPSEMSSENENILKTIYLQSQVSEIDSIQFKESNADRFFFRLPGYLAGAIAGLFGFAGILIGRSFKESYRSAELAFWTVVYQALDASDVQDLGEDKRSTGRKALGTIGLVLGYIAGGVSFIFVGGARLIGHSGLSILAITISAINLIRHNQIEGGIDDDQRNDSQKRLGYLGLAIGALVIAPIGMLLAIAERIAIETWKTTAELFLKITIQAISDDDIKEHNLDQPPYGKRSNLDYYLFGALGLVFGLTGALGFLVCGAIRVFTNSVRTGRETFETVANLGLDEPYLPLLEMNKPQTDFEKHVLGAPGHLVGGVIGSFYLAGIGLRKWGGHSLTSFLAFSGSMLNGSIELPLLSGLGGDNRTPGQKVVGGLGYVLALGLVALPTLLVFTVRKAPYLLLLALAVPGSLVVAPYKWAKQLFGTPRFEEKAVEESKPVDERENRFKNLYSSLSAFGDFTKGTLIKSQQDGRKGPAAFVRKSFSFNVSMQTEEVLDALLQGYRDSDNKAEFFNKVDGEYKKALKNLKEYYNGLNCLEHKEFHTKLREKQFDKIAKFVRNYIEADQEQVEVPDLYSKYELSLSASFWGAKPEPETEVEPRSDLAMTG